MLGLFAACIVGCGNSSGSAKLPPPAARQVTFAADVQPILGQHCAQCHMGKARKANFSLNSHETALMPGNHGPRIVSGDSANSLLIKRVSADKSEKPMPPRGARLTAEEIGILRAWIDQGTKY